MLNVDVMFVDKYYELLSLLLSYSVVVSYYVEELFLSLLGMLNVVNIQFNISVFCQHQININ